MASRAQYVGRIPAHGCLPGAFVPCPALAVCRAVFASPARASSAAVPATSYSQRSEYPHDSPQSSIGGIVTLAWVPRNAHGPFGFRRGAKILQPLRKCKEVSETIYQPRRAHAASIADTWVIRVSLAIKDGTGRGTARLQGTVP